MTPEPDQSVCPHCGLPPQMPEICTPEINEAIERQTAKEAALFEAGYTAGKQAGYELARREIEAQL